MCVFWGRAARERTFFVVSFCFFQSFGGRRRRKGNPPECDGFEGGGEVRACWGNYVLLSWFFFFALLVVVLLDIFYAMFTQEFFFLVFYSSADATAAAVEREINSNFEISTTSPHDLAVVKLG